MTIRSQHEDPSDCARVELELARLVDGETTGLEHHLDLCDGCAALVARSAGLARELAALGEGMVLPDDLAERVIQRAEGSALGAPRARAEASIKHGAEGSALGAPRARAEASIKHGAEGSALGAPRARAEASIKHGAEGSALGAPRARAEASIKHGAEGSALGAPRARRWTRGRLALAASIAAGLAAGAVLLQTRSARREAAPVRPASEPILVTSLESPSGTPDTAELLVAGSWQRVTGGRTLAPGTRLRSGTATRLRLRAAPGFELALNRGSELTVLEGAVRLEKGELLCERSHGATKSKTPFRIEVPTGQILVVGTKLHVAAEAALALIDVLRGEVRLESARGSASVGAGEEGVLASGRAPRVGPAPDLARTTAWAERSSEQGHESEPLPAGVGSLHGQRPGRSESLALELSEHTVSARVQGALARTEIRETFKNSTGDTLEGIYRFPLPSGARISRLALLVDGRIEEGSIEERGRAGKIWRGVIRQGTPVALRKPDEEFVWVPGPWRDPALLEWRSGNQFELRIFPIPARGSRTVILAYTETLPRTARGRRYVYPLAAPGRRGSVGQFRFDLSLVGHDRGAPLYTPHYALQRSDEGASERLRLEARDFVPAGDLVVDFASSENERPLAVRSHPGRAGEAGYLLFSLRPELPAYRSHRARGFVVVADRSYSAIGEAGRRQLRLLAALLEGMEGDDQLALLACDASCRTVLPWQGARAGAASALRAIERVSPGGATDLGEAVRSAGELCASAPPASTGARELRVIYLGDGTPTVGELEVSRLTTRVQRDLLARGARLTTVGVGSSIDSSLLEALARAGGGGFVPYVPGSSARGQALATLFRQRGPTLEEARLELPEGIRQVYPRRLPNLQAGEELLVAARVEGRVAGELRLRGRVNGEPFEERHRLDTAGSEAGAEGSFLPRLWAQLAIDELSLEEGEAARAETVALSKQHQLLSRYTSLIVLESEAMRRAFGVAEGPRPDEQSRDAQAQVGRVGLLGLLGTGTGSGYGRLGLRGQGRGGGGGKASEKKRTTDAEDALGGLIGDDVGSAGVGGLGLSGSRTHATGKKTTPSPGTSAPPAIASGRAAVAGSLDKELIRRVIRRELNSIRIAYQRALKRDPRAGGKIVVQFTIGPTGGVIACRATGATDPQLARDLEAAVLRWRFPSPGGGGQVIVSYPFNFKAAGDSVDGAPSPPPPVPNLVAPGVGGGRWVRMRRVWSTESSLVLGVGSDRTLLERRRSELETNRDSRDRHRRLLQALAWAGESAEAKALAEAWLARDPQSSEALRMLAEQLARLGEREQALRVLGSLCELDPRDATLHARLATVMRDAGRPRLACAHRLAIASLTPADPAARQAADACRDGLLPSEPSRWVGGPVVLRGSWRGSEDLDLALVDGRGRRIGWLSPSGRVRAADTTSAGRESLGLTLPPGRYRIEVSRGAASGLDEPIVGAIELRAPGLERRLPFRLRGERAYLGELRLERKSQLVPAS